MVGILPLIFALIIASTAVSPGETLPREALPRILLLIGASCAAWGALNLAAAWAIGRLRRPILLVWWESAATVLSLALYAWWCYDLRWPLLSPSGIVWLAPYLVLLVLHWLTLGAAGRGAGRWREARHLARNRLRFGVLPALVMLVLFDVVRWAWRAMGGDLDGPSADEPLAVLLYLASSLGLMMVVLAVMPPIVARLWGARPLEEGPLRQLLAEGCARMGVRVARILRWPAHGTRFYNAAVMGVVPRLRYVLFSDDLLRELPSEQIRGVLGHELGHIRHGHLWLYLLFLLAMLLWSGILAVPLELFLYGFAPFAGLPPQIVGGLALVLVAFALLRGCFGVVSRACERQADLAGVELAGDPRHMEEALRSVALLSGQPEEAPSWRHYSIAQRVAFLERLRRDPGLAETHHRRVRRMRWAVVAALAASALLVNVPLAMVADDELAPAIAAAEEGDAGPLRSWMEEAGPGRRAALKGHVLRRFAGVSDPAELYRHRTLLVPLARVESADDRLDTALANAAAYALAAGTAEASSAERDVLRELLPGLEQAARDLRSPEIHDTVGCMLFRLGRRAEAVEHFRAALDLLAERDEPDDDEFRDLVRRRLAACDDPEADLPLEEDAAGPPPGTPPPRT